ncbi:Proteasome subunit beta type-7-B [Picochlorum sp. SENEW3]|jgi:20S proteasome subunit beta 2|nr:Proteasome subunit beta type-7-B [Picochlorum sp. SENEW3]WPT17063.1 Proteasome subunit beta type-7-B [Picochlorum sp. SENEW3]
MKSDSKAFGTELMVRNELLLKKAGLAPGFTKTGTTIVGLIYKDGVVLGADTRSTAGTTVADKNCEKIHYIAPNIYCCGAGTAADTENVTGMISSQLELHRYATGKQSRVNSAMTLLKSHLFKYQGYISAALVLGGVDCKGPQLFTIYPHGSTDSLPYCTMGSGSLNAMAVFEAGYKDGMTREEGIDLVTRAIRSGVYNDLGSGSNVDVCVITKDGVEYLRNHEFLQGKTYSRQHEKVIPPGTTTVLRQREYPSLSQLPIDVQAMDVSS